MTTSTESICVLLKRLKLPSFNSSYQEMATQAQAEGWTFEQYLKYLAETEIADRERRRVDRNLRQSLSMGWKKPRLSACRAWRSRSTRSPGPSGWLPSRSLSLICLRRP